jgi:acyl-CoA reductase-like NAD-dependent aldehyde dehydrogenase
MGDGYQKESNMTYATRMLIDGKLVDGERSLSVIDPATREVITKVGRASEGQALSAIHAAKRAQGDWADAGWARRKASLLAFADAFHSRAEELAQTIVREQGKPIQEAIDEAAYAEYYIRHFAELSLPVHTIQDDASGRIHIHRKPLGVVLGISPWNFPVITPTAKIAAALLSGNTFVLKAAPTTPICALMLAEMAVDIFPPGVLNIIVDDNDLGNLLTSHPDVVKVSFTGSTMNGRKVMASAAPSLKRLTLELGGNDAAIVLQDVDIEVTAHKVFGAAMYNAGQGCMLVKRVYVENIIYDRFCEAVAQQARSTVVGNGLEATTQVGPVQNAAQFKKASRYLEVARRDGTIIAGGTTADGPGYFFNPTIVRDIQDGSDLVDQEQFCPILPIVRIGSAEDGLARANRSEYGLCGSIWSNDVDRARSLATRMESGTVWINQHVNFGPHIPFAGAKQSGIGVEWGQLGFEEYTQISVVNEAPLSVKA